MDSVEDSLTPKNKNSLKPDLDDPKNSDEPQSDDHSKSKEFEFANAPNILTLARIGAVPFVVGLLLMREPFWDMVAGWTFAAASVTDYFDGYLARVNKQITIYGKLLDPLADKFLVIASLVMLQDLGRIHPIVVIILICREVAITGLRALASAEGLVIEASQSAKWKTATQMVAIPLMMLNQDWMGLPLIKISYVLLYLSLGISIWTALDYVFGFFKAIAQKRIQRVVEKRKLKRQKREARRKVKSFHVHD